MNREEALQKHYGEIAHRYVEARQQVEKVLARLEILEGSSVLDVGCGTGNLTFRLPNRTSLRRVVGVDLSSGVLNVAKEHADKQGLGNFEFVQANACHLPFPDGEFDLVVSNMVLHLVSDFGKALAEIARVLRPAGSAVLQLQGGGDIAPEMVELVRQAWTEVLPDLPPPSLFNRITAEEVAQQLSAIGVENFQIEWRRITMRIPPAKVEDWLFGFDLVSGFWRCGICAEAAQRIQRPLAKRVRDRAEQEGHFLNAGNILLVEFQRPGK